MVDESKITGEPDHARKETLEKCLSLDDHVQATPVLVSGSKVYQGTGWYMCLVVGEETSQKRLSQMMSDSFERFPYLNIENRLKKIIQNVLQLSAFTALFGFYFLLIRDFFSTYFNIQNGELIMYKDQFENPVENSAERVVREWITYFLASVNIMIAGTPLMLIVALFFYFYHFRNSLLS